MPFEKERAALLEVLTNQTGRPPIRDRAVLDVISRVPRHCFVPEDQQPEAYIDRPLPIGHGQTISQPYVVASMTEHLDLAQHHRVLEIGTGCGYQTAVLAELASHVFTIEFHAALGEIAQRRLLALGYENIAFRIGDGFKGWQEHAPFDRIVVTCRVPGLPPALSEQLADNGKMIVPIGPPDEQQLHLYEKSAGQLAYRVLYPVRFVPMLENQADPRPREEGAGPA